MNETFRTSSNVPRPLCQCMPIPPPSYRLKYHTLSTEGVVKLVNPAQRCPYLLPAFYIVFCIDFWSLSNASSSSSSQCREISRCRFICGRMVGGDRSMCSISICMGESGIDDSVIPPCEDFVQSSSLLLPCFAVS
jgi:hypothetical protein